MNISISKYEEADIPAVKRFNKRFKDAEGHFIFPESNICKEFPKDNSSRFFSEYFLAKDESGEVRGGYIFRNQEFNIKTNIVEIVFLKLPLSEAVIDNKYSLVGPMIIQDLQARNRHVFALGMGGFQYALPKILKKIGWYMYLVPFYFYISNPKKFLSDFEYINKLKTTLSKRILFNTVKKTRLLDLFVAGLNLVSALRRLLLVNNYRNIRQECVTEFSSFADEIWEANKNYYSFVGKRDSTILNKLYPKEISKFHRIKISKNEKCIGWTVVICTKMNNDQYFGNLNVGTIVDSFSNPEYADILINESTRFLKEQNADLIISNNSNLKYGKAFIKCGFLKGPSNFILALSKGFKDFFDKEVDFGNSFIMRGDGDGPINL